MPPYSNSLFLTTIPSSSLNLGKIGPFSDSVIFFYEKSMFFFTWSNLRGQKTKDSNYFLENKDIEPTEWLKMLSKKVLTRKNMILAPDIPKF